MHEDLPVRRSGLDSCILCRSPARSCEGWLWASGPLGAGSAIEAACVPRSTRSGAAVDGRAGEAGRCARVPSRSRAAATRVRRGRAGRPGCRNFIPAACSHGERSPAPPRPASRGVDSELDPPARPRAHPHGATAWTLDWAGAEASRRPFAASSRTSARRPGCAASSTPAAGATRCGADWPRWG